MTPDAAAAIITDAASSFAAYETTIADLWAAFHVHLPELTTAAPLEGLFLDLFRCLEAWEIAAGDDRDAAQQATRVVASRFARSA